MPTTPGKRTVDRRVEKTRGLLREALQALIREKPYEAITVREILERANVGRSTFYMHFRDKDALLESGMRELLLGARSGDMPAPGRRSERILRFSLPVFEHLERQRRGGHGRMGRKGWSVVHEHLRRAVADLIAGDVREALQGRRHAGRPALPADLVIQSVAATFVLTLNWWVEHGGRMPAAEVNELFRALALPALARIAE